MNYVTIFCTLALKPLIINVDKFCLTCTAFKSLILEKRQKTICISCTDYCCRAAARQLPNLDHSVSYEIGGSPADLYIVEISTCVIACVCLWQ